MKKFVAIAFSLGIAVGLALAPMVMRSSIVLTTPATATGPVSINNTGIGTWSINFDPDGSQVQFVAPYGVPTVAAGKTTAFAPDLTGFKPIVITIRGLNLTGTQTNPASWQSSTGLQGNLGPGSGAVTTLQSDWKNLANHIDQFMLTNNIVQGTQNAW
jgi:hypothetical protein